MLPLAQSYTDALQFPVIILGCLGLFVAIVWIVFPFLVLKRMDKANAESAKQTKYLLEIANDVRAAVRPKAD